MFGKRMRSSTTTTVYTIGIMLARKDPVDAYCGLIRCVCVCVCIY